jgi:hypothetical protein
MRSRLRTATVLIGVFFTLEGVGWLVSPTRASAGLGMPLLDGLARSTQIGDFGVFFLTVGVTVLLGSRPGWSRLLSLPGAMLGGAAILRTLAWALHSAAFATLFIAVELATSAVLLTAARRFAAEDARGHG